MHNWIKLRQALGASRHHSSMSMSPTEVLRRTYIDKVKNHIKYMWTNYFQWLYLAGCRRFLNVYVTHICMILGFFYFINKLENLAIRNAPRKCLFTNTNHIIRHSKYVLQDSARKPKLHYRSIYLSTNHVIFPMINYKLVISHGQNFFCRDKHSNLIFC